MKFNLLTYCILLILALIGVSSFYGFDQKQISDPIEETDEYLITPLIQMELDKKLNKYKQTILDRCREKALAAAELYIDSLVSEEIKFQSSDTLKFPSKPIRPILRDPIILNDSTAITPIIQKESTSVPPTSLNDSTLIAPIIK